MASAFALLCVAFLLVLLLIAAAIFGQRMEDRWREAVLNLLLLNIIGTLITGAVIIIALSRS